MGRIAREILRGFQESRSAEIVDWDAHLAAKKRSDSYQGHLSDTELLLRRGFDAQHAAYVSAHNLVSLLCEELSRLPVLEPFVRIVSQAEHTYMPDGPPFSPLTRSYFTSWAFYDVIFGEDRESMAGCIQALGHDLEIHAGLLDIIQLLHHSRMGLYEHVGLRASEVLLCDIVDGHRYTCHVPTGYQGEEGQLWYVRLLPSLSGYAYHVVSTTPYVLMSTKEAWLAFLDRTVPKRTFPSGPRPVTDAMHDVLKYGLEACYWHDYLISAHVGAQDNAIFLSGIPDRPETLPNAP